MAKYVIAHDLGTGGDKCVLYNQSGELIASAFEEYKTYYPEERFHEQNPEDWWNAVKITTQKVLKESKIDIKDVVGLGFDAQMCGCVPVDKKGNLLRKSAIIWSDSRSLDQTERVLNKLGFKKWYMLTGGGLRPENYSAHKIMWLRENERNIYNKTYKFLGAKDYLIMKLTGSFITDYGEASTTALLDLQKRDWSEVLLNATEIPLEKLPELHQSTDVVGYVTSEAAEELGVRPGLPVVAGTGDVCATTTGAGAISEGDVFNYIGTAAFIAISSKKPILSPESRPYVFCHAVPGMYISNMSIYCGGQAYRWLRDVICDKEKIVAREKGIDAYELMNEKASGINAGSDKLLFIPHLMGGSTIQKSPNTRGAFIGLGINHNKNHLIRSVLEGVAFGLKQVMDEFEKLSKMQIRELSVTGGGGKSSLWRQIIADVMNKKVLRTSIAQETGALGTAIITGVGVGLFKDFSVIKEISSVESISKPKKEAVNTYKKYYPIFCLASNDLTKAFDELAKI